MACLIEILIDCGRDAVDAIDQVVTLDQAL